MHRPRPGRSGRAPPKLCHAPGARLVATLTSFPARTFPRPHAGPAPSRRYERRRPEKTTLHRIVSEHLEGWFEGRSLHERSVAADVEEEFRGYLTCGLLCFGFAHAACTGCGPVTRTFLSGDRATALC